MDRALVLCDNQCHTMTQGTSQSSHIRRQSGQATIFVGMMLMTFILFFAFVVNTGMLVNAKINLQNAADLAAYSGAAVQARQLNNISFLNYEMRRAYKKFLFRYYVLGNMSQDPFPRDGGAGPMLWSPDGTVNYQVPVICVVFNPNDNYCHLASLPKIAMPPKNPLDSINAVLTTQLERIESIRKDNCSQIGLTNQTLLLLWLYSADPDLKLTKQRLAAIGGNEINKALPVIQGLANGLGLIPKEILLRQRIKTLNEYVNAEIQSGLTLEKVKELQGHSESMFYERSISAFMSAYDTLGENTFSDSESITMDELLPQGSNGAQLLSLKDVKASFDTYAADLSPPAPSGGDCVPSLFPQSTPANGITVGVYKDPTILTYYAIRLRAKAKVLFSPFGDMQLTAYAAARPFGSRLGPPMESDAQWVRAAIASSPANPTATNPTMSPTLIGKIPNLPIQEEDASGTGKGWDTKETMSTLYQAMGITPGGSIGMTEYARGAAVAMSPNPWEGNRYNIINDLVTDPMTVPFDSQRRALIWAPLFSASKASSGSSDISQAVFDYFVDPQGAISTVSGQYKGQMADLMREYVSKLSQGLGEDGESTKVYPIIDPYFSFPDKKPLIRTGAYTQKEPAKVRTSFSNVNTDSNVQNIGRVGYSVKIVSFDSLLKPKLPTNGVQTHANLPDGGATGDDDFDFIRH